MIIVILKTFYAFEWMHNITQYAVFQISGIFTSNEVYVGKKMDAFMTDCMCLVS